MKGKEGKEDRSIPGLYIVAHAGGARSWTFRYSLKRIRRKMTLGHYPDMTLAEARLEAERLRYDLKKKKIDPQGSRAARPEGTFGDLVEMYLRRNARGKNRLAQTTLDECARQMRGREIDRIRQMRPSEIDDTHIARVMDPFKKSDSLRMGTKVLDSISAIMTWGTKERLFGLTKDTVNPARELEPPQPHQVSRKRVLNDDEIRLVWHDLEERTPLMRSLLRLILITGQRPGEIRGATWAMIDEPGRALRMPKGYRKRTKADKGQPPQPHDVPLSDLALAELEAVRPYERNGFVFPAKNGGAVGKDPVARAMARMVKRLGIERATPKDLQRTARTRWSEDLRADAVVAEMTQGHVLPKVMRIYDRSVRWDERAELLDRWAERILEIVR